MTPVCERHRAECIEAGFLPSAFDGVPMGPPCISCEEERWERAKQRHTTAPFN